MMCYANKNKGILLLEQNFTVATKDKLSIKQRGKQN